MTKVKITENGGYVVGDGPCPFNPDAFLKAFMTRIIEAKRQGLTELGITKEEINTAIEEMTVAVDDAPVYEVDDHEQSVFGVIEETLG